MSKNIERSLPLSYLASFLIVSLISFINNPDSSSDFNYVHYFTIFIIFSFEIVNAVVREAKSKGLPDS